MVGRPPRVHERDVLKAALEVFCTNGIETPLKMVGKRVGISASAISQRFGSKHDLIHRALETASLCPPVPRVTHPPQNFSEHLAELGVVFANFIVTKLVPAIELAQNLSPELTQAPKISTEPAREGFLKAALQLTPSDYQPRTESRRLLSAYLATLVGELQLDETLRPNLGKLTEHATKLAKDFTPLLIEPRPQPGVIQ